MARPIKMHEDTLFKVMTKSLKPLEKSMSNVSKALTSQSVENKLEGKRAEKLKSDNEKKQTGLLGAISDALRERKENQKIDSSGKSSGMGKGLFDFLKNHWGKILAGLGIAGALTLSAQDIMTAINSLETLMTKEFWEKHGGWIAGGLIATLTLASWAPVATVIGGAIFKYLLTKKLLESFGKNLLAQAGVQTALNTIPNVGNKNVNAHTQALKDNKKFDAAKKKTKIPKPTTLGKMAGIGRLLPVLGVGGAVLGWAAAAATVYAAGDSIKKGFFSDEMAGKDFGDKVLKSLDTFVNTMTGGLIEEGATAKLITDITQGIKDGAASLTKGIIKAYNSTEKWVKKTTANITTKANKIIDGIKSTTLEDAVKTGQQGGGSTFRSKTTHPGGKDDKFVPKNSDPINRMGTPQEEKKKGGIGNWLGNLFGLDKTSAPAAPTSHRIGGSKTSAAAVKHKPISDDGGTTNMKGVEWNKLSSDGRKGVEGAIWSIYSKYGKTPTFVSGLRDENHKLYNPNSQHAYGMAFDLRSKNLGVALDPIRSDLSQMFGKNGWFFQHEVAGQANSTGTKATGDHFHIHKKSIAAATGWHGYVNDETWFKTGEAGSERVDITPMNSPASKMNNMNRLQSELATSAGGSSPVTVINQNTSNSSNNQTAALIPQQVRSKQYTT